jgi:hypothetical protein
MTRATTKEKKMTNFKIVAVNNDTDTCSCCGRTGLKRVAWVAQTIEGIEHDPAPFGTTCAANAVVRTFGGDEFKQAFNRHDTQFAIKQVTKSGKPAPVMAR